MSRDIVVVSVDEREARGEREKERVAGGEREKVLGREGFEKGVSQQVLEQSRGEPQKKVLNSCEARECLPRILSVFTGNKGKGEQEGVWKGIMVCSTVVLSSSQGFRYSKEEYYSQLDPINLVRDNKHHA